MGNETIKNMKKKLVRFIPFYGRLDRNYRAINASKKTIEKYVDKSRDWALNQRQSLIEVKRDVGVLKAEVSNNYEKNSFKFDYLAKKVDVLEGEVKKNNVSEFTKRIDLFVKASPDDPSQFLYKCQKKIRNKNNQVYTFLNLKYVLNNYRDFLDEGDSLTIWGGILYYLDKKAFWIQINELILREEYHFSDDSDKEYYILDVGVNIGVSIFYFKKQYPNSKIVGFEPLEECYQLAIKNVSANEFSDVSLYKIAISDKSGIDYFHINENDSMGGALKNVKKISETNNQILVEVKCEKLSKFIDREVDFLKLDIEGSECKVLKEIEPKLGYVKRIFCEYHYSKENPDNSLREIINILEDNNFVYQIGKSLWFNSESELKPFRKVGEKYSGVIYAVRRDIL